MTKIGVLTDSHRAWRKLEAALENLGDCSYILHLGDHDSDMDDFPETARRLVSVRGNCDLFSMQPSRRFMSIEGIKLLLTHGDCYGVKRGLDELAAKAAEAGCALALFGHTHSKCDTVVRGVRLINPGALRDGAYAVITIDDARIDAEYFTVE